MKYLKQAAAVIALAALIAVGTSAAPVQGFQPEGWNELRQVNNDGTITAEFHQKFINFVDDSGKWKKIDLKPTKDAQGFHIKDAPYSADMPLKANGDIKFTSTNRYSVKEKKIRDDVPVSSLKKFDNAVPVDGVATSDGVLYPFALPNIGASLLLQPHEMEFRYLVVWDSLPPQCINSKATFEIPFTQTFNDGVLPRKKDKKKISAGKEDLSEGFSADVNEFRGIGTPIAHIWDSSGKTDVVEIQGKLKGQTLSASKIINCSSFVGATYPVKTDATSTFYPDPHVETVSVDGYIQRDGDGGGTGTSWSTHYVNWDGTGGGGAANDSATTMTLAYAHKYTSEFGIGRGFALFDTSSLTSSASISAAVLSFYTTIASENADDADNFVTIVSASPASNTAIAQTDFPSAGSTKLSNDYDVTGMGTAAYKDWTLNASGIATISTTGVSKFATRSGRDLNSTAPTVNNTTHINVTASSADAAGTTQDPKLVVTYTLSSPNPIIILLSSIFTKA